MSFPAYLLLDPLWVFKAFSWLCAHESLLGTLIEPMIEYSGVTMIEPTSAMCKTNAFLFYYFSGPTIPSLILTKPSWWNGIDVWTDWCYL